MEDNYSLLLRKIDEFIRKYYKNQLIRGGIYTVALLGGFYVLLILLEYYSWFGPATRSVLFYLYITLTVLVLTRFVLIPLGKLKKIGKLISHEQAASIIGVYFPEVRDRLLNTLQLRNVSTEGGASRQLIEASIDQKVQKLKPISFSSAINLKENRKHLRYALPPMVFIAAALLLSPRLITGPSDRIIHHKQVFERPAPFSIEILNKKLEAIQQDDFTLQIEIKGEEVPEQLFLETAGARYRMDKTNSILYSYTFKNLQQNTNFVITADQYNSKEYSIRVYPKPIILAFDVLANYPAYLKRKPETFENTGDLTLPEGTQLSWKFYTRDTKKVRFRIGERVDEIQSQNSNVFQYSTRVASGFSYSVFSANEYFTGRDSLAYSVSMIPDLYPSINVEEFKDSVYDNRLYFRGEIKDDYGISRLVFHSSIKRSGDEKAGEAKVKDIAFDPNALQQQYYYFLDVATLYAGPGDEIEYYFEVWDNDGIHGAKSTRSPRSTFRIPTMEEIEKRASEQSEGIKEKMERVMNQSRLMQRQIDDMNKKLVDKKELGWQEKQQLKQLIDKNQSLQQQVEDIRKENMEMSREEQQYKEISPELLEKQQQLQQLFDQLMPEEMKKMMEELQELLEKVDKDKVADMLEKMKDDNKDLEKQLDRSLELFKQYEFEKKLQETIDKLKKTELDQEKLAEETNKAGKEDNSKIEEEQEKLNKEFEKIREDLNDLQKKNEELEQPNDLENTDQEEQAIEKDMQDSKESLKQNQSKSASQSQKNASKGMKSLGQKLQEMQEKMESENEAEDEAALRDILDNLVKISFTQEELMRDLDVISTTNPKYLKIIEKQNRLKDDLKMVEDSLFAISKRQPMIEPFVLREVSSINSNVEDATKSLNSRVVAVAKSKQQYVMTSVNNIALMLAESLNKMQLQNQQKGQAGADGKCNNPGGSGNKMKSIRQMQEQLNKQLQEMKEGMDKPGKGKQGQKQMSEQMARMAAQQEALRRELQKVGEELQKQGSGVDKQLKEAMQKMDQTETDIVNKRITRETLLRQQEILTRLLESEKAMQQRGLDEKRESNESKDQFYNNPSRFFEYKKLKEKEDEMIHTVPPHFTPFYKRKADAYILSFEK